jgi:hypothetical protein
MVDVLRLFFRQSFPAQGGQYRAEKQIVSSPCTEKWERVLNRELSNESTWKQKRPAGLIEQVFPCALVSKALRLNHHHRRGANDGDGASTRTGTDYRSNNIGDSNADNSHRNIPDKGRNKRARQIYQSNRQPSLFEVRKPRAQALTKLGEDIFS